MTITLKHGYAPIEQYQHKGQGPWTDVYGLSATIYYCLTGKTPPQALDRLMDDEIIMPRRLGVDLTEKQEKALLRGMGIKQHQRFRTVEELHTALYEGVDVPAPEPELPEEPEPEREPVTPAEPEPEVRTGPIESPARRAGPGAVPFSAQCWGWSPRRAYSASSSCRAAVRRSRSRAMRAQQCPPPPWDGTDPGATSSLPTLRWPQTRKRSPRCSQTRASRR